MPAVEKESSTLPKVEEPKPVVVKPESEKDLVTWIAPARPFKRRNREFFVTVIAMASVSGFVVFLIEGWLPVLLIISLVFLFYVMSTVEPENIQYKITTKGISVGGKTTTWDIMNRFWFAKRFESELLVVETAVLPGRLEVVVNSEVKEKIKKAVSDYLVHEEVPPSYLDKIALWFSKRMPGNK